MKSQTANTKFIATKESMAVDEYKEMVTTSESTDLRLTNLFTGANAYYLKDSIINNEKETGITANKATSGAKINIIVPTTVIVVASCSKSLAP